MLITHLRATEDNDELGANLLEERNDLSGSNHVPNVYPETNYPRLAVEYNLGYLTRGLRAFELDYLRSWLQVSEISIQVPQAD
jgi:hypothetical protein